MVLDSRRFTKQAACQGFLAGSHPVLPCRRAGCDVNERSARALNSHGLERAPSMATLEAAMLPIVDVSGLSGAADPSLSRIGIQIGDACRDTGFFFIVGHDVPQSLCDSLFDAARGFFSLPQSAKDALALGPATQNRGYVSLHAESLRPGFSDTKEAFNIGVSRPDQNLWPDRTEFRTLLETYAAKMQRLGLDLHRAIARDLDVDADYFAPFFRRPMSILRLLHYPAVAAPTGDFGAGEHTDYGNLTLLMTDGTAGLEVRTRHGEWMAVPGIPGAFLCNVGDCLMRWTNDIFVSTPHRVVQQVGQERYSVAFFCDPDAEAVVSVIDTCFGPDRPLRYAPVRAADYFSTRFAATYGSDFPAPVKDA